MKQYPLQGKTVYVIVCSASGNGAKAFEAVGNALPDCHVAAGIKPSLPRGFFSAQKLHRIIKE